MPPALSFRFPAFCAAVCAEIFLPRLNAVAAPAPEEAEFFEQKIRPVLVAECYECHCATKHKGGLRLDYRGGWQAGGDSGDAIVPGDAGASLLIRSIRHEEPDLKMPAKAPKLDDKVISDFEKWVDMGAPDPRDEPPADPAAKPTWEQTLAARKTWWSLQPVEKPAVPDVKNRAWSEHPVDRFLLAKMEARGLAPAPDADAHAIVRRLTFALTGLPPTADEIHETYEQTIDRLLASPRFGEHWARHWMDLMRYAETHGSENDPEIPQAWRYRDYLIRAFNADVPADQLIREHLAGDLLAQPRMNPAGFNESLLGIAQFRLVEHGFQPVDTLDDQVKAVDNQIDVVSKAFQALTVSCARCHDHKFDAVSQRDYYALYGIFASCRPAQVTIDAPEVQDKNRAELETLHARIKAALADAWTDAAPKIDAEFPAAWERLRAQSADAAEFNRENFYLAWNLAGDDYARWFAAGAGLEKRPFHAGEFSVEPQGDRILSGIHPGGALTHRLSGKHGGLLSSPRFKIETDSISVRAAGGRGAAVRVIVDNYPLPINPIFPKAPLDKEEPGWIRLDTAYRKGSWAYIEFGTRDDLTRPLNEKTKARPHADGRSWFGVEKVVFHDGKEPPKDESFALSAKSATEPGIGCQRAFADAVAAWKEDRITEPQRALLDAAVRGGVLPVTLAELEKVRPLVAEYRRLEAEIATPQRAPGVLEADSYDAPLLPRGDHTKPGEAVPRGYLAVFGHAPYRTAQSGRLELADEITSSRNPLTARVMVNRIWHWLFGRGLAPTVDNFGRLGERPTHPELLDFLAARFVEHGWDIKETIRFLVTTRAFQMSSAPSPRADEIDPANEWLSHMRVRRLEAEAIRDSLLAVSGELDFTMFGKSVGAGEPRRSIYLEVRRTNLDAFLQVFDAPKPFTTLGRREATNVPAQSLALLNSPFVIDRAKNWARTMVNEDVEARIRHMFTTAFARPPDAEELAASRNYLSALAPEYAWQDFAQSLFNLKEFIYVR